VPIAGGPVATLSHEPGRSTSVNYDVTHDGTRLIYEDLADLDGRIRLYSIPIEGGTRAPFSPVTLADSYDPRITPGGSRVVFRAGSGTGNPTALYSEPIEGGDAALLGMRPGTSTGTLSYVLPETDSFAIVMGDLELEGVQAIYRVPLSGGGPLRLSPPTSDPELDPFHPGVSPDGTRVVFGAIGNATSFAVYSAPTTGGAIVPLSPDMERGTGLIIAYPTIGRHGEVVAFDGTYETPGIHRIYVVPITGGTPRRVSPNVADDPTRAVQWNITNDRDVIMLTDVDVDEQWRVYRTSLDDGSSPELVSLDPGTDPNLDVSTWRATADGRWIVYYGDVEVDNVIRLYARRIR